LAGRGGYLRALLEVKTMAHTDACKIQVTEFVKKLTTTGLSVNEACKVVEQESDGIPSETIRRWWKEIKAETAKELVKNDQPSTTPQNHSNNPIKRPNQPLMNTKGQFVKGTAPGPGRTSKYGPRPPQPYTNAIYIAGIAISQLERIESDDPKREEAFKMVSDWLTEKLKGRKS
jgi:hypothetical protein